MLHIVTSEPIYVLVLIHNNQTDGIHLSVCHKTVCLLKFIESPAMHHGYCISSTTKHK